LFCATSLLLQYRNHRKKPQNITLNIEIKILVVKKAFVIRIINVKIIKIVYKKEELNMRIYCFEKSDMQENKIRMKLNK
jgi:hypothetical protein